MVQVTDSLAARLAGLKAKNPHAYPRDFAAMLGVSEAELTPVFYPERAIELFDLESVLSWLAGLKRVKLMARTAFAVFELFTRVAFKRETGVFVLSSPSCLIALANSEVGKIYLLSPAAEKEKAAILVFDRRGTAALKLYIEAYEFDVSLLKAVPPSGDRAAVDLLPYIANARHASVPVNSGTARVLIESAAAERRSLAFEMINPAVAVYIIHVPAKIADARGWFNILDENFNLHLKDEAFEKTGFGDALHLTGASGESIKIWRLT